VHARLWAGRLPRLSRRGLGVALLAVAAVAATVLAVPPLDRGGAEAPRVRSGELPRTPERLRTLQTNRPKYWHVALDGFADAPLRGTGSRGFSTLWLEHRPISESTVDAHSLEVETLAELGLVGALFLAAFLGGAAATAARLIRAGPDTRSLSLGWIAAAAVFLIHSAVDWDWEMPAVALIFLALLAAGLAASERRPEAAAGRPLREAAPTAAS
jgi:O-antigen ligase